LMVTLSVMMMFSLVCLSSCNSSVNSNGKGGKTPTPITVKITVIAPKEGGSIKVNGEVLEKTKEFTPKIGDTMTFEAVPDVDYYTEWNTVSVLLINEDDPKIASLTVASDNTIDLNSSNPMKKVDFEFIKKYIYFNKDNKKYDEIINSMGFGRKTKEGVNNSSTGEDNSDDNLHYLTYCYNPETKVYDKDYGMAIWEADDIKKIINVDVPTLYNDKDKSIRNALDTQWISTQKHGLELSDVEIKSSSKSFKIADGYRLATKMDKENSALYVLCSTSGWIYFADWKFVFLDKGNPNMGYILRFGEFDKISKSIRPYILVDCKGQYEYTGAKGYKYAPGLTGPMYCKEAHEFKLSDIIQDMLKNKLEMLDCNLSDLKKSKIMNEIGKMLLDHSVYDVYMLVDIVFCNSDNGDVYNNIEDVHTVWQHVLKLTDSKIWKQCFKD
jgi:hypothetical protein